MKIIHESFSIFPPFIILKFLFANPGLIGNVPVMFAKPQTFMNSSGESVSKLVLCNFTCFYICWLDMSVFIVFYEFATE